jgi:hypothetical protein
MDLVLGWKDFNGTPHFGSLPRGERRIERISPHPYPLPQGEREEGRWKDFNSTPHPEPLPRGGEGTCKGREGIKGKILKTPSP